MSLSMWNTESVVCLSAAGTTDEYREINQLQRPLPAYEDSSLKGQTSVTLREHQ